MSTKSTAQFTPAELEMIRFAANLVIEALAGSKCMEAAAERKAFKRLVKKVGGA